MKFLETASFSLEVKKRSLFIAFVCSCAMSSKLHCPESELHLKYTLNGGQCFRWKENGNGEWIGVFHGRVWKISRDKDNIIYDVFKENKSSKSGKENVDGNKSGISTTSDSEQNETKKLLVDYFRLDTSLKQLYDKWSEVDPIFREASTKFYGIRIMKQDPVENIFSFICSTNNFISRISSMVEKLCKLYGEKICELEGVAYHNFPSVTALAQPGVEEVLRNEGFGYRAKYIHQSALRIIEFGGSKWLDNLQNLSYGKARTELTKLHGIGAKVADCICLMSLGHMESVPVDTHVFQIASQFYLPHLKSEKSVTTKIYEEIGNHFRNLYGPQAGWAQTILFCADLKMFQGSGGNKGKISCDKKINDKKEKCTKTSFKSKPTFKYKSTFKRKSKTN